MLPVLVLKIFTFYINDVLLFKCPVPGPIKLPSCQQKAGKFSEMFCRNIAKFGITV